MTAPTIPGLENSQPLQEPPQRKAKKSLKSLFLAAILVIPNIILLIVFTYRPLIDNISLSFYNWNISSTRAAKFIDFMTNTENTITFTQETGYMPVRTDAADNPEQKKYMEENPNATTAIKQLEENTKSQDYARVFVNGGGQKIGGTLDKIVAGQDVEKTFKALQEDLQKVIDRDIKPNL